jgi:hypothetical protein
VCSMACAVHIMCNMGKLAVLPWVPRLHVLAENCNHIGRDAKTIKQQATVCASVCSVQVMVFAVLHSANTECGNMLLQPDADGMTGRPQVAAVICRFRIFRSTSHWEHVLRQEPRDRLDLDCMHTGMTRHGYTETSMQQCLQHSAQCSQRCSWVATVSAEHWAGQEKQLYGAVGTCLFYHAALLD